MSKGWSAVPGSPQTKCSIASIGQTATRAPPGQRSGGRATMAEYGGGFMKRARLAFSFDQNVGLAQRSNLLVAMPE